MNKLATILTLCCLLVPWGGVRAEESGQARFAVVVGHNRGNARTLPLNFAEKDAEKMATLFRTLAGVPEANLVRLSAPTPAALREALAQVQTRLRAVEASHTELFFYYSGHADAAGLQLGRVHFSLDELRGFLKASGADVTVAIIDACHSGAIVRDKGGKRVPLVDLTLGAEGRASGLAIITSSAASEKSQESDELRGSFFTHFLASGMRGDADVSRDGRVTLSELYQYAYNKTRQRTYVSGSVSQHPTFDYAMTGSGELVVSYPGTGRARLILPSHSEGNYLLYAPAADVVLAEVDKKRGETRILAVPPGRIELFRRTDVTLHKTTVEVAEGEEKEIPAEEMVEVSRTYLLDKGPTTVFMVGAKGGYQVFWNSAVRSRSLLPSMVGGIELRAQHLLGRNISPFVEVLVGGAASSSSGGSGPLAQTFSFVEAGGGVAFTLLDSPILLEVSPQVGVYYAHLSVDHNESLATEEPNRYAMATPSLSLMIGKEFARTFSLAAQVKAGYLYFRDSVSDFGQSPQHLGFTEVFLTAGLKL